VNIKKETMLSKRFLLYFAFAGIFILIFVVFKQLIVMLGEDLKSLWGNIVIRRAPENEPQHSIVKKIVTN